MLVHFLRSSCGKAATLLIIAATKACAYTYTSEQHVFSVNDVIGTFEGHTFDEDNSILCGVPGVSATEECPVDVPTITDERTGVTLYPIDSEFGFNVYPFLGAAAKTRNADYREGYAGNIVENGKVVGLELSDAPTDTYNVPARYGTWCPGLGDAAVKCSSEHYCVAEHVLTCHESVPYLLANPETGDQFKMTTSLVEGGPEYSIFCANEQLDNEAFVVVNGDLTEELDYLDPFNSMSPNDNTEVLNNIAVTDDFSVTLKDDGKLLYRWGSLIKRPNDIRLYARIPLPEEWKESDANYSVTKAVLVVDHLITNNPNDQLRAEDMENEGATGRKPSYSIDNDSWLSTRQCFEGDGDLIEAGTVYKNEYLDDLPYEWPLVEHFQTEDLIHGFTNAWYTTLHRDPFEWSYVFTEGLPDVHNYSGFLKPLSDAEAEAQGLEFVSGPRWRLRANKFGQDVPGLEIPVNECSKPPFKKDNIKYTVGERVETYINLLDWDADEEEGPSPLSSSQGWINYTKNDAIDDESVQIREHDVTEETVYFSSLGLPLTDDFDLAVYIKGDTKPTAIYSAYLDIEYEGVLEAGESDATEFNLAAKITSVAFDPFSPMTFEVEFDISNKGSAQSPVVSAIVSYSDNKSNEKSSGNLTIGVLEEGASSSMRMYIFDLSSSWLRGTIKSTVTLKLDVSDANPFDNEDAMEFEFKPKKGRQEGKNENAVNFVSKPKAGG